MSPLAITSTPLSASPEEAAAIAAALESFMRATTPLPAVNDPVLPDGWHATALLEGVSRDPWTPVGDAGAWLADIPPG